MSDISIKQEMATCKPGVVETLIYRALVGTLILVSMVALLGGRLFGAKSNGPIWQEAKEAAYAVAGYAFKY